MLLRDLTIENFALIDQAHLTLGTGLNIITGETGAGKSIFLDAINLVLGGRASAELIRAGEDAAQVEAHFSLLDDAEQRRGIEARLNACGITPDEEGDLIIRRILGRGEKSTKNRITINGQMVTRNTLLQLAQGLIDCCGQQEHQVLLNPENHRRILDTFLTDPQAVFNMQTDFARLAEIWRLYSQMTTHRAQWLQRLDLLTFQIQELETAAPQTGEMATLDAEQRRLAHVEELLQLAAIAQSSLSAEETGVLQNLQTAVQALHKAARLDARFEGIAKLFEEARINLSEAEGDLDRLASTLEANPHRLKDVEERIALLHRLERKHGLSIDELLTHLEKLKAEAQTLGGGDEEVERLKRDGQAALAKARQSADALGKTRRATIKKLEAAVVRELQDLGMQGAQFKVELSALPVSSEAFPCSPQQAGLGEHGSDSVQFRLAPNPGEGLRPLDQIASGGELSRILLALKCVLAKGEFAGTYLFDEIDAGVGGVTGTVVGRKLKRLSETRQVLCITHLPQIAGFADRHFRVRKSVSGGKREERTRTAIEALSKDERIEELARMLGGGEAQKTARAHAQKLLEQT